MPDIPPAAIAAATEAMNEAHAKRGWNKPEPWWASEVVTAALEAAAPLLEREIRERIAASLRRAAEGRREYAGSQEDDSEARPLLLKSAEHYESAALIIEDPRHIMGVIPSWRWTAEESER